MTLDNLFAEGQLNHADFLARVDILGALGRTVLISKFAEFYRLAGYLFRYTKQKDWSCHGRTQLDRDL